MYRAFGKRAFDIVCAVIALALLAIPFVLVAICIKLDSKGPVFFRHKRAGKNLVPFTLYKFRTMAAHTPHNMPTRKFKDADNYITGIGKILRKLSIDELPQLFNVLKGDMTLVGPRPVVLTEVKLLKMRQKHNANTCLPGITGLAQVNGRDEVRILKKATMDGEYAKNVSFLMDVKCIALTVWAVLLVRGHKEGHHLHKDGSVKASSRTFANAEDL